MQLDRPLKILGSLAAVSTSLAGLVMAPALKDLIGRKPTTLIGVRTLDDAAALCGSSGLNGWELVSFAHHLVSNR